MATRINNEQRSAFSKIVEKTTFVDKELEAKLAEELAELLVKYATDVKGYETLQAKRDKLNEEAEELSEQQKVIEKRLEKVGIDRESNYNEKERWDLTWEKNNSLTEKLNGKFKNFKEQIVKKIWASQEVEVAENLVDEFLARNKAK